jgi:hypothetical protein
LKLSGIFKFFHRSKGENEGKEKEDIRSKDLMYYLKEGKSKDEREPPRTTYYINVERIDDRFTQYFFSHGPKVTITTQRFGEAGMDVNWLVTKIGGKVGGMKGKTVEIDNERIPPISKALLIESYARDKGLLLHPVNDSVRQEEVLYKYVGECYFVSNLSAKIVPEELNSVLDKKVLELIEHRRLKQEKESEELAYRGSKFVWLVQAANRTVVSIFSTSNIYTSTYVRGRGPRDNRGFIGSFEDSVQVDGHNILFLTPWWIWHL